MKFTYHGRQFDGFDHPHNTTILNERAIELAVAIDFLAGVDGEGLEVGHVLGHYGITGHRVVDLHEQAEGVENIDVLDIEGRYDWIVSISTLEHVHWDNGERNEYAAIDSIAHLRGLLKPGGRMLLTVPMGWNPPLDRAIADDVQATLDSTMVRTAKGWRQTKNVMVKPYGLSTQWAESVWLGEFEGDA